MPDIIGLIGDDVEVLWLEFLDDRQNETRFNQVLRDTFVGQHSLKDVVRSEFAVPSNVSHLILIFLKGELLVLEDADEEAPGGGWLDLRSLSM